MKAKIISALKTKYANRGFSDKAYDGVAEFLSKTVTEESQIEDAVSGVDGLLKAFQGEVDKVRGEKTTIQKELDELKAKTTGGDSKPSTEPANPGEEIPAWAKTIIDQNKVMTERLAAFEAGKATDSRKAQLETKLQNVNPKFRETVMKAFGKMKFETDDEFSAYLTEVETDAAEFIQTEADTALSGQPKPAMGFSGGKDNEVSPGMKEYLASKKEQK